MLLSLPLEERRRRLEAFAASRFPEGGRIRLSPATTDQRKAKGWFQTVGGGLDHFTGGRFRHGARFLRWRPDKAPRQCTMAQVESESRRGSLRLL